MAISPTFLDTLATWGVAEKTTVVPNWAPLAELPVRDRVNPWSERMGVSGVPVVLYSGTLGLKHDPSVLALLADELAEHCPSARMVVVSEGKGREWLETYQREHGSPNLVLLDYQPYEDLPQVLASADVLVALLEPDASRFSVPSKVLTYLCTRRAILAVMPRDNSVARILDQNGAGVVVDPAERDKVAVHTLRMLGDDAYREQLAASGRRYAEATFSPDVAADRFESVFRPWLPTGAPEAQRQSLGNPA